jgi:hypothetical protein
VTRPQAPPETRRVIAAVAEHADRPAPGPPAPAVQRRNCIHEGQCFLPVVTIGAGEADRERYAASITDQMSFAPAFRTVGRIRTGLRPATHRALNNCLRWRGPIDVAVAREPTQEREVHQVPNALFLPIAQSSPTGHPRSAAEFPRQHLPRNPAPQDEQNSREVGAIRDARASTFRSRRWSG